MSAKRRKPRVDSVLKTLPRERQDQIAEWCEKTLDLDANEKPIKGTGGLAYAQSQCAADGLRISLQTLSEFYRWWRVERDLEQVFDIEESVRTRTGDPKFARETAETLFLKLSVARQDPETFATAAMAADSRRRLELEEASGRTKAEQKERALDQKDRDFALAREKFVVASCEKILLAARDPKTREVAESSTMSNAEKIAAIRKAYFADIDATEVKLPE